MSTTYLIGIGASVVAAVVIYLSITSLRQKGENARALEELREKQARLQDRLDQAERSLGDEDEP